MPVELVVVSAGAAQSVVQQLADELRSEGAMNLAATFGAVGAQKERAVAAQRIDLVILTQAMIEELMASGHVVPGSRMDLGSVCGAIAVARGQPHPDVATASSLTAALKQASSIYIPDPAIATAGKQFLAMCARLAIGDEVRSKLRAFPNGFTAMTEMARGGDERAIGCTQITEIKLVPGVELVAPLPEPLRIPTVYSLGIATRSAQQAAARELARRLAGPQAAARLAAAGFQVSASNANSSTGI